MIRLPDELYGVPLTLEVSKDGELWQAIATGFVWQRGEEGRVPLVETEPHAYWRVRRAEDYDEDYIGWRNIYNSASL